MTVASTILAIAAVGGWLAGLAVGLAVGHWYGVSAGRRSILGECGGRVVDGRPRSRRWSVGPITVYAYHDHPTTPARSPLYVGLWVGRRHLTELHLSPWSRLRPFAGGAL